MFEKGQRVRFIDAGRGSAMFFVLLSHFLEGYFPNPDALDVFLGGVAELASPTFMLISGTLVGFLYRLRPHAFAQLRTKLIDRGLFLLTIGHLLLLGGHYAMRPTVRWLPITDAVGVSMLVTPWIVAKTRPATRLIISFGLYALGWLVVALWHPGTTGEIVKETLVGNQTLTFYAYVFPLLPWFCLDLAATVLGEKLAALHIKGDRAGVAKFLDGVWSGGVTSAIGLAVGLKILFSLWPVSPEWADTLYELRALHQRIPPGPVYLAFHASLGVLVLRLCFAAEQHKLGRLSSAYVNYAAAIGQSSLFTFVWQTYVYYTGLHLLHSYLPFQWAWPVYFVATVQLVVVPALWWHRAGLNRLITVGYPYLIHADASVTNDYDEHAGPKRSIAS